MICKLCLQEKKLVKSHIIPNYMYDGIFDTKHKIVHVDFVNDMKTQFKSDGVFDTNLLCSHCDNNVLGSLENYFAEMIYEKGSIKRRQQITKQLIPHNNQFHTVRYKGLDYNKIKLFLLSILWRASITKQPFFKEVDLGSHTETIRKMLIENKACKSTLFHTILLSLGQDGSRPFYSIIGPRRVKKNSNTYYIFYINGLVIYYNISNNNINDIFHTGYINEAGEMDVTVINGKPAQQLYDNLIGKGISYTGPFKS